MSDKLYTAANGVARVGLHDNDRPEDVIIKTSQDVEPVLDGIARDRETMRHGHNKLAARIPTVIYEELQRQGIADDPDLFKAWLNSSDAAPWRIWKGSL